MYHLMDEEHSTVGKDLFRLIDEKEEDDDEYSVSDFLADMPTKLSWQSPRDSKSLWVFWSDDRNLSSSSSGSVSVPGTHTNHSSIKEKIKAALSKDLNVLGTNMLVQFWAPKMIGGRCFLTTSDQPFGLKKIQRGLCSYWIHCLSYKIDVDGESEEELGPAGRVFRHRLPESTPDVRYYSSKEYPQRDVAVSCGLQISHALPVFETSGRCCVGVLELVYTAKDLFFKDEILKAHLALKAANLKSSDMYDNKFREIQRLGSLQHAVDEIKEVLKVVCATHQLPIAQAWAPLWDCSSVAYGGNLEKSYNSFDLGFTDEVVSTITCASYASNSVTSLMTMSFQMDCRWRPLRKGQGLVGKALLSSRPCFCRDITQVSITEYPFAHYAHKYGFTGCFAICLQSTYTGNYDYVLEFFLPLRKMDNGDLQTLLESLLATMKQHFQSFKVASGEELGEELSVEIIKSSMHDELENFKIGQTTRSLPMPQALQNEGKATQLDPSDQQLIVEDTKKNGRNDDGVEQSAVAVACLEKTYSVERSEHLKPAESFGNGSTVTTMCRENDILSGPSHKRNKVDETPSTLKQVDECDLSGEGRIRESSTKDPSFSDQLSSPFVAHTIPNDSPIQDVSSVTIKAAYRDYMIKFRLPFSSGLANLVENVSSRLKKVNVVGPFSIKYKDDDGDYILIACDEDLQYCMDNSRSAGTTVIRMLIQPKERK